MKKDGIQTRNRKLSAKSKGSEVAKLSLLVDFSKEVKCNSPKKGHANTVHTHTEIKLPTSQDLSTCTEKYEKKFAYKIVLVLDIFFTSSLTTLILETFIAMYATCTVQYTIQKKSSKKLVEQTFLMFRVPYTKSNLH